MEKELEELKAVREKLQEQKDQYNIEYETFVEQHKELTASIGESKNRIFDLTTEIKLEAIEEYEKTGNKTLTGGVKIKLFPKMKYDVEKALKWAIHHEMALSLDKRRFEQLAKIENIGKTDNLDFVEIEDIPQATIPANIMLKGDLDAEKDR